MLCVGRELTVPLGIPAPKVSGSKLVEAVALTEVEDDDLDRSDEPPRDTEELEIKACESPARLLLIIVAVRDVRCEGEL